ncbi:hypothetical protein Tco_1444167 [Tanacetum coccineum]
MRGLPTWFGVLCCGVRLGFWERRERDVRAPEEVGEGSAVPTDTHHTTTQPSTSRPQKKRRSKTYKPRRLHKVGLSRRIESSDDVSLGTQEDANELMDLYAKLSDRVLTLENTNTSQVAEIVTLKESVKKLEKKRRSKTYKPKRLHKVGLSRRTSDDASLGAQEDASKQGRKIADLDADTEVTLNDETQGRNDEDVMFDT